MLYPHKPGMAAWLNQWAVDFAARTPDCLHTATFFPEPGVDRYVAESLEAGARVFKAHLQVGGYDPRDPLLTPVWRRLAAGGVPVVVHCGSGPHPGAFTGPQPMAEVLAAHPDLVLVVAHMGMPEYAEFAALAARYDRVHLDTTMAFTDFVEDMAPCPPEVIESYGRLADRVLSAATSRTSRIRTRISSRRSTGSAWARTGCGACCTTTRRRCSGSTASCGPRGGRGAAASPSRGDGPTPLPPPRGDGPTPLPPPRGDGPTPLPPPLRLPLPARRS
jgi:hypothetical protein